MDFSKKGGVFPTERGVILRENSMERGVKLFKTD